MVLAFDMDDILVPTTQAAITWHNIVYGTDLKREDVYTQHFWKVLGVNVKEGWKRLQEFYDSEEFLNMTPYDEALEYIPRLASQEEIIVLTVRQSNRMKQTREYLDQHFPNCFTEILKASVLNRGLRKKSKLCEKYEVRALVEDQVRFANPTAKAGILVYMPKNPWNRNKKLHSCIFHSEYDMPKALDDIFHSLQALP